MFSFEGKRKLGEQKITALYLVDTDQGKVLILNNGIVHNISSCSYGASSSHPRRVIESSSSSGVKIESSSSSVEVPLENSSVYLFIFERR